MKTPYQPNLEIRHLHVAIAKMLPLAAIALAAATAHADFVNGSFETGDFTGWNVDYAASGSYLGVRPYTYQRFDPGDGNEFAYFGAYNFVSDTIGQEVSTTPGQTYILSFIAGENFDGTLENFQVTQNGTSLFNGPISNITDPNTYLDKMLPYSFRVTGTGNDLFSFSGYDLPGLIGLDDVHLTPVPEPAPAAYLGICTLGLVVMRRKRSGGTQSPTPVETDEGSWPVQQSPILEARSKRLNGAYLGKPALPRHTGPAVRILQQIPVLLAIGPMLWIGVSSYLNWRQDTELAKPWKPTNEQAQRLQGMRSHDGNLASPR